MTKLSHYVSLSVVLAALFGFGGTASAQKRVNDLPDQPPVRHRRLLVKHRFELSPLFEVSLDAPFKNTIGGGLKLEYHFSDQFSIGLIGVAGGSFNTSLVNNIAATLPANEDPTQPLTPSKQQYLDHLNSIPFHGALYLGWTPWYGKLSAFGAGSVAFDFYFQAGVAFAQLSSNCPTTAGLCDDTHPGTTEKNSDGSITQPDDNPRNDPPMNSGTKVGMYVGGGIHVFVAEWLAIDLAVRDYGFSDNPSGADTNADLYVGKNAKLGDDNRFLQHLFFGVGFSFMLPPGVKRTP